MPHVHMRHAESPELLESFAEMDFRALLHRTISLDFAPAAWFNHHNLGVLA
jgi:hypothetical protein